MSGRSPQRCCVACGTKASQAELRRFVLDPEGRVRRDPSGRLPGRGAYLCDGPACREAAGRARTWSRAFRRSAVVAPELEARPGDESDAGSGELDG